MQHTATRRFSYLTAATAAVSIFVFYKHCIWSLYTSADTGWLAQTGAQILQHGLPVKDCFSWTNAGASVISYQWLFEVCVAILFQFGSIWLVGLAACFLSAILLFVVLPTMWKRQGVPVYVPLLVVAAMQTPNWFHARPQLCSYYFIIAFLLVLENYRRGGRYARAGLLALPLLMALWANLHSLWCVGLFISATYLASACCREFRSNTRARWTALAVCLVICLLATLLNPFGPGLWQYLLTFINGSQYMHIWEVMPAPASVEGLWSLVLLPAFWWILIKQRKHVPAEGFVLSAVGTIAALSVRRFQPLCILLMWPFLGYALAAFKWKTARTATVKDAADQCSASKSALNIALSAAAACAVALACFCLQMPDARAAWMIFTEDSLPLLAAVQKVSVPEDRLFCDPSIGSWLIALRALPVFVDTRFDFYPKQLVWQTNDCLEARPGWSRQLDKWQITQVVVKDSEPLNQALMYAPDWELVLNDGQFAWWMRSSDLTAAKMHHWMLEDEQIRSSALPQWMINATVEARTARYLLLARVYRRHNLPQLAMLELRNGLRLMPESRALLDEQALCLRLAPPPSL